jgi:chromosome segregation ATPase
MGCCHSSSKRSNEEHEILYLKISIADLENAVELQGTIIKELRDDAGHKEELLREKDENTIRGSEEEVQVPTLNDCISVRNAQITTLTEETDTLRKLAQELTSIKAELQDCLMVTDKKLQELNAIAAVNDQPKREKAEELNKLQLSPNGKNETIRTLNKTVGEKETEITELRDSVDKKEQQIQVQLQDSKNALREKDNEIIQLKNMIRESKEQVKVKSKEVQALNDCICERNALIKALTKEMDTLKESARRLQREMFVNKQLQNATKLHELETSSHKSVEIEELISRIKEDMAGIGEHLAGRIDCLPVEQAAAAAVASSATKISVPSRLVSSALI